MDALLSPGEIAKFKRDGYFIKRGLLEPSLCAACRDLLWTTPDALPQRMVRGERATYRGPFREGEPGGGYRCTPRRDVLSDHEAFVNLLPQNPRVQAILEQLLGEGRVQHLDANTGGVVGTLPMGPEREKTPNRGHVDSSLDSRDRLSCAAYIDDVAP